MLSRLYLSIERLIELRDTHDSAQLQPDQNRIHNFSRGASVAGNNR